MIKELSVFFPLFNEEGNVLDDVKRGIKVLEKLKIRYEIILVDDGSKDKTGQIADDLAKNNSNIKVIHHQKNLGYGEALRSGFYNAKYETIVYTDGDGQFDFSEIEKFLEKIKDHDLVIGFRIKRRDPFFRILFKKGWKFSLLVFFGLTFKDVDCGFKMIKREVLEKIPKLESTRGAMINAEIVIKAKKANFKIGQVGVNHFPRLSGQPTGASLKVIFKSYFDLFKLWWKLKDQKLLFLLLLAVISLAAFLRIYRIDQYMTFLGDEGRDALVVRDMLLNHHFPLIGPPMSLGNIYLGPFYYYMMFISMAPFNLNPVAAVLMNAVIGLGTVTAIYYLGKVWFGRIPALISSFLYAISPVAIIYSRSSWNPNPLPFFALMVIFSLHKLNQSGNFLWIILLGASLAAATQMHYLALFLIPIGGILYFHEILYRLYKGQLIKNLVSGTLLGIFAFLMLMSPLLIFDLRHDFLNYKALTKVLQTEGPSGLNLLDNLSKIPQILNHNLIARYVTGQDQNFAFILTNLILIILIYEIFKYLKDKKLNWPVMALFIWLMGGLFEISFYKGEIYDHYLNFLNPSIFLLIGYSVSYMPKKGIVSWLPITFFIILISILFFLNLDKNPLKYPPNNQLKRTQDLAKFIISQRNDKPFNFALLAQRNYDAAYNFYLDKYGYPPKKLPFEKTDQLFVICEDPCDPIYSPKYEIAAFGWTKVENIWEVSGLKVYKLIHNPEEFK